MKIKFITSVSKEYWFNTGQYCVPKWNLPGDIIIYIDQKEGDVEWFNELPFEKRLLHVPSLEIEDNTIDKNKVNKFWGKASAQLHAVYNIDDYDRVVWIDADVQQKAEVPIDFFEFEFKEPLAILNTKHTPDAWETGLVIFNNKHSKLKVVMNKYKAAFNDDEILSSLWKPYDAEVLGYVAKQRGYYNLCNNPCINVDAFENSILDPYFKHWINKTNKQILQDENS